ncbi:EAL domain-containing protein [Actinoplanes sp. Pm04-4]|uniref:EAL domain-containing protein n=1 Tax=Paractinoplanes pyxinae TaxID=2997416 RepID=A0ABT4BGP7_9ACTN|nr:EAL domain-containing protein [Actinoplanes pyxinae]MCY1145704.1 EAL domain-containing protein [Actinoplanes pyxinae]
MATPEPVSPVGAVTIHTVLADRLVQPVFQPIVDLASRTVVGVEALARGPAGSTLEFPDRLFATARDAGVVGELDLLCCERALEDAIAASVMPPLVFVNGEPGVMNQPLSPRLIELVRNGLPFRQILEFTERALPAVPGSLLRIAGQVQQYGNGLALDDVGVDPMSLAFLPVLEPEVIKLDMSLLRHPQAADTTTVCTVVRAEADCTGAVVIAEGIETEADLVTARALGADWGQGWLFGRPAPLTNIGYTFDHTGTSALRAPRPGFHQPAGTPWAIAAGRQPAGAATADAVAAAAASLRDLVAADLDTMVIVSCPATSVAGLPGSLEDLVGRARSVMMLDEPITNELVVAVVGAGYGAAVCIQTESSPQLISTDHLPTVAALIRAVMNRLP